jgi:uncharacterized protein YcbK (DUF882 family)
MREKIIQPTVFIEQRRKFLFNLPLLLAPTGLLHSGNSAASIPQSLMLDLQRAGQRLRLNLLTAEGYQAAAWMLRDIQAGNRVGWPSPELLAFAAHLQRALTEHHAYTVFTVTSGLRTHTTNRKTEGAAQQSRHLPDSNNQFFAMDIKPMGATLDQLLAMASRTSFGGVGRYDTHLHLDVRQQPARW